MDVTRNVVQDLIPLYLAGEASADTRALVEEHLARDPALADAVKRQTTDSLQKTLTGGTTMSLPQDHEVQTLSRTRSTIAQRSWTLGLAIGFTLFPMSFVFSGGHIQWIALRDSPSMAMAAWAAAVGFWVGFAIHNRRLRASGL
jgi:anti-sigma factor RsiW